MKIIVLAGGESSEREVSLNSGKAIAAGLEKLGHQINLIDTRDGRELLSHAAAAQISDNSSSVSTTAAQAAVARFSGGDLVFLALHGGLGENGTLQAMFDLARIPYTGSGVLASALCMDKQRAKMIMQAVGVPIPRTICFGDDGDVLRYCGSEGADQLEYPIVVKPNREGSTVGLTIAHDYKQLLDGIGLAADYDRYILLEEYIPGRELTVAVLGEEALPPVEIVPKGGFYDYEHKYTSGASDYICPAQLDPQVGAEIKELAVAAFLALGCHGYARADFRLNPNNELFCLEMNTLPGMTSTSLVPKAAAAAGLSFEQLLARIIELAQKK